MQPPPYLPASYLSHSSYRNNVRQRLRANLNDYAFGPFDLLFRVQKSRVTLQGSQDRLVHSKSRDLLPGRSSVAAKTRLTQDAERYKNP